MKKQHLLLFLLLAFIPFLGKSQNLNKNTNELSFQVDKKDASSINSSDAYIKIKVTEGVAPYRITTFTPYASPTDTFGDEVNLMNIKSGDYFFVVRDASGNTITKDVIIVNQR